MHRLFHSSHNIKLHFRLCIMHAYSCNYTIIHTTNNDINPLLHQRQNFFHPKQRITTSSWQLTESNVITCWVVIGKKRSGGTLGPILAQTQTLRLLLFSEILSQPHRPRNDVPRWRESGRKITKTASVSLSLLQFDSDLLHSSQSTKLISVWMATCRHHERTGTGTEGGNFIFLLALSFLAATFSCGYCCL